MKATITSKGQITIPHPIRERLHLQPGQVLEFDEQAPFLKATKSIDEDAMHAVIGIARQALADQSTAEWVEELRGPAELPPKS